MSDEHVGNFFKFCDTDDEKPHLLEQKFEKLKKQKPTLIDLREEHCYYVASTEPLTREERKQVLWLIEPNHDKNDFVIVSDKESYLRSNPTTEKYTHSGILEIGPRLNFCSPFSTNAVSILRSSCPSTSIYRLERSTIYEIISSDKVDLKDPSNRYLVEQLYDRMVETIYNEPVKTFSPNAPRAKIANGEPELQPCADVDIMGKGEVALRNLSKRLGLFFDDWDIAYYVNLFKNKVKRNPTVVECFDLAQSNSEHSRHWFFKGILDIRGRKTPTKSLIDMVAATQTTSNQNNVIKFEDNSSAIKGFNDLTLLKPKNSTCHSIVRPVDGQNRHIIFTAETHNFPTGVAPFPGAATGTGGRIRDVQATGRGAHVVAGTAGYSFGNLLFDDYELDWENPHELYPNQLAEPRRIAIEASNGASDYGNKFGEPIISGFARSFGLRLISPSTGKSERWEYLKPIMFTGGIGTIDDSNTTKLKPQKGFKVAKIGGPVYRIGIGGGAASSASEMEGTNSKTSEQLNFNAVQRGDPEMEQKLNRFIRACIENTSESIDKLNKGFNPILSIHDQGAGGNGNVLKEIVEPLGATIDANKFTLGDSTINILELWAAEYQESNAILTSNTDKCQKLLEKVAKREKCSIDIVGEVEKSGQIRLINFIEKQQQQQTNSKPDGRKSSISESRKLKEKYPIDLKLDYVVGSMPRKKFSLLDYSVGEFLSPARLIELEEAPKSLRTRYQLIKEQIYSINSSKSQMMSNFEHLLEKVLKLPSVGSKRYLTTKVDRCVTGLIAGQQCLGPLHTPIGDYALIAMTHFDKHGSVTSIGEQPIKGLVSPISNATMSVAEAITNMMFCVISSLEDVKCSANWMWAAKLPGEGAKLFDACEAMCNLMSRLGIAVDGGKDSLSMSTNVDPSQARKLINVEGDECEDDTNEIVKSPGTLVISAYAPVEDIHCKVTPILRCKPKLSHLIYINLAHPLGIECDHNKFRLGGSAILQTLGQIGDEAPNIDHPELLKEGFNLVQELIQEGICTAGHDVSDGGLIVCALEMAIASHCGIHLNIKAEKAFRELSCANDDEKVLGALFSEECAVIIEVEAETISDLNDILDRFEEVSIPAQRIGFGSYENERVTVKFEQQLLLEYENNHKIRECWELTSKRLDLCQANKKCILEEYENLSLRPNKPDWKLSFDVNSTNVVVDFEKHYLKSHPKVAVLREEGINGDREMIASLVMAGFEVFDVTVTDLNNSSGKADLNAFDGLVFPGGFSYADVFGSGRGWAASLIFNPDIRSQLLDFRRRSKTFSLGVCNGCQLMSLLGFLDDLPNQASNRLNETPETSIRLEHNDSGRFECRFVNVRIEPTTNSIMLKDMEESVFGVWVAHGEGKFKIELSVEVENETRVALKYVNDKNEPTMEYPSNPNGSDLAAAGVCSRDGRHLAMMPHPERCTQLWQWPYLPEEWKNGPDKISISPWMQMFVNAYEFCQPEAN